MSYLQLPAGLYAFGPIGGTGGTTPYTCCSSTGYLQQLCFKWGQIVDGGWVNLNEANKTGLPGFTTEKLPFGGTGGYASQCVTPTPGAGISRITGTMASYGTGKAYVVQSIQVYLQERDTPVLDTATAPKPSESGGTPFQFDVPPGYELAGVFGHHGQFNDRLGFALRPYHTVPLALVHTDGGYKAQVGQGENAVGAIDMNPGDGMALSLAASQIGSPQGTYISKITFKGQSGSVVGQWPASWDQSLPAHYKVITDKDSKTQIVELRDQQTADFASEACHSYTVELTYDDQTYTTDPQIIDKPGG